MTLALSDFKASARRRSIKLPVGTLPLAFETDPVSAPVEAKPALSVRERMEKKNPALSALIDALDLEELSFSLPPEPEAVGVVEPRRPAPDLLRLATIAQSTFSPNTCYSADEAAGLLSAQTGVSTERAVNGLTLMLESNLLTVYNSIYYLTDSIPF